MLQLDTFDTSEGIDVTKKCVSKELTICHHGYFLEKWCKFQLDICNECHHV